MIVEKFRPACYYSTGYNLEQAKYSVDKGWHGLLEILFSELEKYPNVVVSQVKEKFGGLRIYTNPMNDEFELIVASLERDSYTICETCGKAGKLRSGDWMRTLCEEHADGKPATNPF